MYKIRTNGNVNLAINDIKIAISASNVDGMLVPKDKIDNSKDAQRLIASKLLIVEEVADISVEKKSPAQNKKAEKTVFVTEGSVNSNPGDIFVRTPERKTETAKVEEVTSLEQKEIQVEAPAIVADLTVDEVTTESEITTEATAEIQEVKEDVVVQEETKVGAPAPKAAAKKQPVTRKKQ